MREPLVSVIITTYKRTVDMIEEAVKSVLSQTYNNIEIIIVDDNSNSNPFSKGIIEYVKELNDNNLIFYVKQNGNKGACAARNLGVEHATGVYYAFLDDDDVWMENKIEKQINMFIEDSIGMVFCKGMVLDDRETETLTTDYYTSTIFKMEIKYEDLLQNDYIGTTSQAVISKECWKTVGGFYEKLPARQDYEMWIRISQKFRIVGVDEVLFQHRMHEGEQISKNHWKAFQGNRLLYKRHKNDKKNLTFKRDMLEVMYWRFHKIDVSYKYYFYWLIVIQNIRIKIKRGE